MGHHEKIECDHLLVDSLEEMLKFVRLEAIVPTELSARNQGEVAAATESPDAKFQVRSALDGEVFIVEATVSIVDRGVAYKVSLQAQHSLQGTGGKHTVFSEDSILAYAEDVAMMAVYPYFRSHLAILSSQMGRTTITLPLVKRGQIHLAKDE